MQRDLGLSKVKVVQQESGHPLVESAHFVKDKPSLELPDSPKHMVQHPRVEHKYHDKNREDLVTEIEE
jgi:hypothetical protein